MDGALAEISKLFPRPGRAWDSYGAYLFDIDGTLVHARDAVHYAAFIEALKLLAGRPLTLDGVVAHGNTDRGILRDALMLAGIPENLWRERLPEGVAAMCGYAKKHKKELSIEVLAGAPRLLSFLRARGAVLGVATGNLETIGRLKLKSARLLKKFDFCIFSDECETRTEVFELAAAQARSRAGSSAAVCAIGDTPADIRAARSNQLGIIAVATGIYSLNELARDSPDWLLGSLEELFAGSETPAPGTRSDADVASRKTIAAAVEVSGESRRPKPDPMKW